jgi:hypothetical protein
MPPENVLTGCFDQSTKARMITLGFSGSLALKASPDFGGMASLMNCGILEEYRKHKD